MTNKDTELIVMRILGAIISIALSISGYFLSDCYSRLGKVEGMVTELRLGAEKTSGNRFTSVDWLSNKAVLDSDRQAMERRVIVLEQNFIQCRDILLEIKSEIKSLRSEHYGKVD